MHQDLKVLRRGIVKWAGPSVRKLCLLFLATCLGFAALIPLATSASAASGDYTFSLTAPASAPLKNGFAYTATLSTPGASDAAPATDIILTSTLAPGLELDSLPSGPGTPVKSYTYDPATRVVTFTLNDITKQLTTFTYSVKQVDNMQKALDTVLTTTLTDPSGDPVETANTAIIGDLNYRPTKSAVTVQGSNNRNVTYYLDVHTNNAAGNTVTFTSWQQTITDTLPKGAIITNKSSGDGGTWTTTNNVDGTTTLTWDRSGAYGPRGPTLTDLTGKKVWFQVNYPIDAFPAATIKPPKNVVSLEVKDRNGNAVGPTTGEVQSPDFAAGASKDIYISKGHPQTGDEISAPSGNFLTYYTVKASYLNNLDDDKAGSMTVQDAATDSSGNADFYAHTDTYYLRTVFNPSLRSLNLPYTFEYTTSANNSVWRAFTGPALTTAKDTSFIVQTVGSNGMQLYHANPVNVDLPVGERLTGWRVVVSPGAALISSGSQVDVEASVVTSYPNMDDLSVPNPATGTVGPIVNTATGSLLDASGANHSKTDTANVTIPESVNIATFVDAPSSIQVGSSAVYQATISNLDPVGRSYKNSVLDVVLPKGVMYDPSVGITPALATTPTTGVAVPTVGNGLTVTTSNVTDANGDVHQVVHLVVADLPSLRKQGNVKDRSDQFGFRYNIPTRVLPQAFDTTQNTAPVTSWAFTNDPLYSSLEMHFYNNYYGQDTYDLSAALNRIAKSSGQSAVNTSGGLLLDKQVRADASQDWGLQATVESPGTVQWQIYATNALPQAITNAVIFDRLPSVGDGRATKFPVTLNAAIAGAPANAVIEYSTDATSVDNGTWTNNFDGAKAFRLKLASFGSGENLTLVVSSDVPTGLKYQDTAVNDVTATADYQGRNRKFSSNKATVNVEGKPAFSLVKKTNGVRYTAAPGASVATGSTVTWSYAVTNTGDTALDSIAISDAFTDGSGKAGTMAPTSTVAGPLQPGETRTFTATGKAVEGQYENTATATAKAVDAQGKELPKQPKEQSDRSWYLSGDASLTVVKTTNGQEIASAPGPQLNPGDDVTWAYKVTNTGSLTLKDVDVSDKDADGESVFVGSIATLAAGASVTLDASGKAITGQYHNTVTASAANPLGGDALQASDESWYFGAAPGISLLKQVSANENGPWTDNVTITSGADVYWQFTVASTGNTPLTGIVIGDAKLPAIPEVEALLPGESKIIMLKQDNVTTGYTNVAIVSIPGSDVANPGNKISVTSEATVKIKDASPALAITGTEVLWSLIMGIILVSVGLLIVFLRRERKLQS